MLIRHGDLGPYDYPGSDFIPWHDVVAILRTENIDVAIRRPHTLADRRLQHRWVSGHFGARTEQHCGASVRGYFRWRPEFWCSGTYLGERRLQEERRSLPEREASSETTSVQGRRRNRDERTPRHLGREKCSLAGCRRRCKLGHRNHTSKSILSAIISTKQGTLDVMVGRSGKQDAGRVTFIRNNAFHDAFFLKALGKSFFGKDGPINALIGARLW